MMMARYRALTQYQLIRHQHLPTIVEMMMARYRALTPVGAVGSLRNDVLGRNDDGPL